MKTLKKAKFWGKRVLLRVDLNSSIINGKIQNSPRFKEHAKTIKEISDKGAAIVLLTWQGRKGKPGYKENLSEHAKILSKQVNKEVKYVNDLFGKKAIEKIINLKSGEILLLKNVRSINSESKEMSPKQHSQTTFVKRLSPLFDFYIQDALSVCHRSHSSVVGFPHILPSYIGKVLEKELKYAKKINTKIKKPLTLILGGTKTEDYFDLIQKYTQKKKAKNILTAGLICLIAHSAKGTKLGTQDKILKNKGYSDEIKKIKKFLPHLTLPTDFAIESKGKRKEISLINLPVNSKILDLGKESLETYTKVIKKSKTIFIKGSIGNYEKRGFEKGTKKILEEIGKSKAFSIAGGGDTTTAIQKYKIKGINHTSLSGGALLEFLSGKELPGLEILR